jgi:hypothetical protein
MPASGVRAALVDSVHMTFPAGRSRLSSSKGARWGQLPSSSSSERDFFDGTAPCSEKDFVLLPHFSENR